MGLEREAGPRSSGLCPWRGAGGDWHGLFHVPTVLVSRPCAACSGGEALRELGRNQAGVQERWGPTEAPGSGDVSGRRDETWCLLEVGGWVGQMVPSLCSVIPGVASPVGAGLGDCRCPWPGVWAQRCLRAAEAEEPGRRGVRWAGRPSGLCPPLQPSPRTVTSTHFRGPCPGRGCRNHHPGQTLGPSCWRFNHCHNPNHTQAETPTPGQESCVQGLPQGHAGKED